MSGPYPPSGYPQQPDQSGWGNQPYGAGQSGQYGVPQGGAPQYDFPTVSYGGLAGGQQTGWGEGQPSQPPEPPRKRSVGRIIVAVVSCLIIVGGVATGIYLLHNRSDSSSSASGGSTQTSTTTTPPPVTSPTGTTPTGTTAPQDNGVPNGQTALSLTVGQCVSATGAPGNKYSIGRRVTCGATDSDLVLAQVASQTTACAENQYVRVAGPNNTYCFTLDVKQGDCLDNNFLKVPCASGVFAVLKIEPGPGGSSSCGDVSGATRWVPANHDPVAVGCIGPAKSS